MFNTGNCPSVPIVANLDGNNGNNWNDGSWLWFLIAVNAHQLFEHFAVTFGIFEQGADILKLNPRFGEVRDVSQVLKQKICIHKCFFLGGLGIYCFT